MQFVDARFYRVKEIAEELNVSAATIYRAIDAGKLKAASIGKSTLRVRGAEANAYLAASQSQSASDESGVA